MICKRRQFILVLTVAVIVAAGFVEVTRSSSCEVEDYSLQVGLEDDYGAPLLIGGTDTQIKCWGTFRICKGGCVTSFKYDVHVENSNYNETAKCSSSRVCCKMSGNHETIHVPLESCNDGASHGPLTNVKAPKECSCSPCVVNEATTLSEDTCHRYFYHVT